MKRSEIHESEANQTGCTSMHPNRPVDTSKKRAKPPRLAEWLLVRMYPDRGDFTTAGDLEEVFQAMVRHEGRIKAYFWYWWQLFLSVYFHISETILRRIEMLGNMVKWTFRHFKRQKGYSFINLFGMALGMCCCILILVWILEERSYDRFHSNRNRLYRLVEDLTFTDGRIEQYAISANGLAGWLENEYSEIERSTRFFPGGRLLISIEDRQYYENGVSMVDPAFLEMFSFPLIQGDKSSALKNPNNIILSQSMAQKYFGSQDVIGQSLLIQNDEKYSITGVFDDIPSRSHLQFDFLVPVKENRRIGVPKSQIMLPYAYLQLSPHVDVEAFETKIKDVFSRFAYTPAKVEIFLQPLERIHLFSDFDWDLPGHGDINQVRIFSLIAIMILLIACINFMNLATARSNMRMKEVVVRKMLGSTRRMLISQFFGETIFLCSLAMVMALILCVIYLPFFNQFTGKQFNLDSLLSLHVIIGMIGIMASTATLSAIYPALKLSSFKPTPALRTRGKTTQSGLFRRVLVIFQFTVSIVLISAILIVMRQLSFIRNSDLGYDRESILYLPMQDVQQTKVNGLKQEILRNPKFLGATILSELPTAITKASDLNEWRGKPENDNILMRMVGVDTDAADVLRLEMKAGRFFSPDFPTDQNDGFVINETAARIMGLENPVGQRMMMWRMEGTILGIVKDFHFQSLQMEIEPLVMRIVPEWTNYLCIRIPSDEIEESISTLSSIWNERLPDRPIEYHFLDQSFESHLIREQRTESMFAASTVLAILISCLGLFGLASYWAERRTKEIGIRKVLGANVSNIIGMMMKEFFILIVIANGIALPIARTTLQNWMNGFAYQSGIPWSVFLISAILALLIAFVTVSHQAIKAAVKNPVDSLRVE